MKCFLRTNSPEIRDRIPKECDILVCGCALFPESEWLCFSGVNGVHGVFPADDPVYQSLFGTKDNFKELFLERHKDFVDCGEDVELFIKTIKDERDEQEDEEGR